MDNSALSGIINSPHEFRPDKRDPKWIKRGAFHTMKSNIRYDISDELMKTMKKYTKLYEQISKKTIGMVSDFIRKPNDNIAVIYKATNSRTGNSYIGYTTNKLYTFIKLNLHKRNLNQGNVFQNFSEDDLRKISFSLLEYVKYKSRQDIFKRKDVYLMKHENNKETEDTDRLFDKRMLMIADIFDNQKHELESFNGYIFKITNKKNKKVFIGGYKEKISMDEALKMINNNKLRDDVKKYGKSRFEMEFIEKYKATTKIDFMLRIDYFKIIYRSIAEGYNIEYLFSDSPDLFAENLPTRTRERITRKIFVLIQKYLFDKHFHDSHDYNKIYGFIYEIRNKDGNRFISYSHGRTLREIVMNMYDDILKGNVKHSKILKALSTEPYSNFRFKIKKIKTASDFKLSLKDEAQRMIIENDTIKNGYNIDHTMLKRRIYVAKNLI